MTLDKLKTGECGRIISVRGDGELRHHLLDMGLTPHGSNSDGIRNASDAA